jgi:hypothetical protein
MTARGTAGGASGPLPNPPPLAGEGRVGGAAVNAGTGARSLSSPESGGGRGGISKRKLRPKRLGKPAGTGPTSAAGKARSAQNARKHGLNVAVMHDPDVSAEVAFMTEEIVPGCQDPELTGRARQIAEAQVDLMRVARVRRDIISAATAGPDVRSATGVTAPMAKPSEAGDPGADTRVAALSDISARLARLDRYERGALWRRKCAIRAFDTARPRGDPHRR